MLPESKNIQTIADNIRLLENQINALDVEIPPHASTDSGKVLSVDSDGDLEWRDETPYIPPSYSTEEVNTGQKWIDGKDIYRKVYTGTLPTFSAGDTVDLLQVTGADSIISVHTMLGSTTLAYDRFNHLITSNKTIQLRSVTVTYSENPYFSVVEYTKVTETKSKKGGNKK